MHLRYIENQVCVRNVPACNERHLRIMGLHVQVYFMAEA